MVDRSLVRCSLTFLAIQEPGISKYCERCGKEYLVEEALLKDGQSEEVLRQPGVRKTATTPRAQKSGTGQTGAVEEDEGIQVQNEQALGLTDKPAPLVRMLFATCDVCVYCGGKFVG